VAGFIAVAPGAITPGVSSSISKIFSRVRSVMTAADSWLRSQRSKLDDRCTCVKCAYQTEPVLVAYLSAASGVDDAQHRQRYNDVGTSTLIFSFSAPTGSRC
jgi:hypothetical protein